MQRKGTAKTATHWLRALPGSRQRERNGMTEAANSHAQAAQDQSQIAAQIEAQIEAHIEANAKQETKTPAKLLSNEDLVASVKDVFARLRIVSSDQERLELARELTQPARATILGFINAHAMNLCWSDLNARRAFLAADVLLRDGVGMAMLRRRLRLPVGVNMNGTDFIPQLLTCRPAMRVALFGSQASASASAAAALRIRGVDVIATIDGFQPADRYIDEALASKPDVIVLGMGMPVQEQLALKLREAMQTPCLIINGGAIIDFLAGRVSRAPNFIRSLGLEWTYRLANEPLRLFKRYVIGNPLFLLRAQKLSRSESFAHLQNDKAASRQLVRGIVIASPGGQEGRGGMGTVTKLMAQQLRTCFADCPLTIIDPRGHGSIAETPHKTARALAQLIKAQAVGANVLHLQVSERSSFLRKGLLAFVARKLGMAVILHHHGAELIPFYRKANALTQRYVRSVVARADVNIVLGHIWRAFLVDELGANPEKVVVLRNGVPDLATRITRDRQGSKAFRILSLAQLSERKGTGQLLQALAQLRERGLDIEAVFAGAGELEKYKKLGHDLRISDKVTFTGWIDRSAVERQLSQADALALPSDNEGLPMAIIEALSLKLPVIATPVGAIPEVLQNGRDCLLVPPHDPAELANAIAELATNPQLGNALAEAGRQTYDSHLTIELFTQNLWAIYEKALSARAP